jgi:hypothetical protein
MPLPVFHIFKTCDLIHLKRIYIAVINDLATDQRVRRVAQEIDHK